MHAHEMIATHPDVRGSTNDVLIRAIEECYDCAQACSSCADACVAEGRPELVQCIRLNLDCADICYTTGVVGTRRAGSNESIILQLLELCAGACRVCAEECEKHAADMDHCRICAEACRRCEQACMQACPTISPEQLQ